MIVIGGFQWLSSGGRSDAISSAKELGIEVGYKADVIKTRDAVLKIRARKGMLLDNSDNDTFSAGSFFTNPIVPENLIPEGAPKYPQADGTFKTDYSYFNFTTTNRTKWKPRLLYADFNNDGKKDVSYIDCDLGLKPATDKTIFIRNGSQFNEVSFFQVDSYAKSLLK